VVDRGDANTEGLRHLANVALTIEAADTVEVALDAVYGRENVRRETAGVADWLGVSGAGRWRFGRIWGFALRAEVLSDGEARLCGALCEAAAVQAVDLLSFAGALQVEPDPHVLVRLEGRHDAASHPVFPAVRALADTQTTVTLGVVGSTR